MIPDRFDYFSATTLSEAIQILQTHKDEAKILAGGHSLIPLLKLRLAQPKYLVDINKIDGLDYIKESDDYLRIGALTRYSDVENSELIRVKYPVLAQAAAHIGDPLVRNMGTIGGNVCHSDPANDLPAVMLALEASMVAVGPAGERIILGEDFFVDTFQTALKPGEILTEIRIPLLPPRSGGSYQKLEKRVGDFPIVGVATQVSLSSKDVIEWVGIGLTAVGSKAIKAKKAEESLRGKKSNESTIKEASEIAASESDPTSDMRGPSDYKRDMVRVLTMRGLERSVALAEGA
jgi:carbon-monoxide dehydrogenase medium subunit